VVESVLGAGCEPAVERLLVLDAQRENRQSEQDHLDHAAPRLSRTWAGGTMAVTQDWRPACEEAAGVRGATMMTPGGIPIMATPAR
jgi:hypothetical protein